MDKKYLVIDKEILPEIFEKIIEAKELLRTGKVKEITEAVKKVGVSRSTYYKYKDHVFTVSETSNGRKANLNFLVKQEVGVLSNILKVIAQRKGNILTINQDIPIYDIANVSITFDISKLTVNIEQLINDLNKVSGVVELRLIAIE